MLVRTDNELSALCAELRAAGSFALDTEFIREKTYRAKLCLIQVATRERVAAVDPFAVRDLQPFLDLVLDAAVEKVLHAGEQDMEIVHALTRRVPCHIVDTQVAAALAGHGESVGYGKLVEELTGVRLSKVETFTDWAQRPLRPEQIAYALDDVRYLLGVHDALRAKLEALGRLSWLADELRFYEDREHYEKDPALLYLRVRSAAKLEPRELAVLRELAAWREEEAERLDVPRGRVVLDEVLIELARRAPTTVAAIGAVRGIHPQLVKRSGEDLVKRVQAAKRLPKSDYPAPLERRTNDAELALVVDLLEVVLRARATEAQIAPAYVGSRKDLADLARQVLRGDRETGDRDPVLLTGWRRELAGEALLELLAGRSQVVVDPAAARVQVVRDPATASHDPGVLAARPRGA